MKKIYDYLLTSESEGTLIKGLKVFGGNSRAKHLIDRLNEYNSENLSYKDLINENDSFLNQPNRDYYVYRRLAIKAIIEYIKSYPFLMHTPSSLRAVFGMPTRKDRKRGKFSGKELIEMAILDIDDFSDLIDYESIYELKDGLKELINDYPESEKNCNDLIEYLEKNIGRNSLSETIVPEISTHSKESLEKAKSIIQSHGFKNVIHEAEIKYPYGKNEEEKILTPDLICEIWDNLVWFELKEWANFNIFLSPIKQLMSYLYANIQSKTGKSYIGILVEKEVDFFKFLAGFEGKISLENLRKSIQPYIDVVKDKSDHIHNLRNDFYKIGQILIEKYNLQVKAESLYIGLMSEFINKEIGMINTELEAGLKILDHIKNLKSHSNEVLILTLDSFKNNSEKQPKQNFIIFLGMF